jgi:hypothetical protein
MKLTTSHSASTLNWQLSANMNEGNDRRLDWSLSVAGKVRNSLCSMHPVSLPSDGHSLSVSVSTAASESVRASSRS